MRAQRQRRTAGGRSSRSNGIATLVVVLMSVALSEAAAAERLEEEAREAHWLATPGRIEAGGYVGGGLSTQGGPKSATVFLLLPRVGYVIAQQERFLPGSIEVLFEPGYYAVIQDKTASVFSGSAFFKYNFSTGTKLTPFLETGAGVSYATRSVPEKGGSHFNFVLQAGLGLQYAVGNTDTLNFECRFNHISNGDIYPPNPSLNSVVFLLGFSHFFR